MKKILKKVMMCATVMAALVGFSSCEDELDVQTNYPFEVEVMPVPTRIIRGQTVEIRCHLAKEGDYKNYCCPIKIGIDKYSFENASKQAIYVLVSKSNPS